MVDELKLTDMRVKFMAIYLIKTLNIKTEKWNKLYMQDENKALIDNFLNAKNATKIIFFLNPSQNLAVYKEFPKQIKSKVAYFVKKSNEPVKTSATFQSQILYGDLSEMLFDQIYSLLDGVSRRFYC